MEVLDVNIDALDNEVRNYTLDHPLRGERMVVGVIWSISETPLRRVDIRDSIARVDEGGLENRRAAFGRRLVR